MHILIDLRACALCCGDESLTKEHIFPESIGGTLTSELVCKPCNDYLGSEVDAKLASNGLIQLACAALSIKGKTGKPPNPFRRLRTRTEPPIITSLEPDRTSPRYGISQQITKEIRDDRVIFRGGKSRDELFEAVNKFAERRDGVGISRQDFDRGLGRSDPDEPLELSMEIDTDLSGASVGALKIAYELTLCHLGPQYLSDPLAGVARAMLGNSRDRGVNLDGPQIQKNFGYANSEFLLEAWTPRFDRLIAVIFVSDSSVDCALRFFRFFEGVFRMSDSPSSYPGAATMSWIQGSNGIFLVENAREVENRISEHLTRTGAA